MDSKWIALGLMTALAALMIAAAISDVRSRTISNRLNLAMAALAPLFWVASGLAPWPDMLMQAGAAFAVFLLFLGLFAIGAMGGGDVKMIGAVMLWVSLPLMLPTLTIMAIAGGLLSIILLIQHKWRPSAMSQQVPYGVAIAAAGLWALHQHYFNQFEAIGAS
ncbi:A24 family peptidase [Sphingopyxis sp. MWB1]|uniref:A24 family peptidase n=1 Tax=Sphingopyxis sp. MWB1 TaxID=1537715 RepID=UPI00051A3FCA|nr:prepilin peptidase [Sphingopyxis sp. MWB1]